MKAIKLNDLQVGQTYYIHQVKDEDTHKPLTRKYKAVCTIDYSTPDGWVEFVFENVKGIHTKDISRGLSISLEEDRWGIYKIYLCESDEIIERVKERVTNTVLKTIIGDPSFMFY